MKHFLLFFLAISVDYAVAQTLTMDKVPPAAANAFKQKFPNGSQPGWSKEEGETFRVGFINGKKQQTALFDATGKWLQTESEINYGAVPGKVQRAFETEFEGYQIQEVFEVETDKGISYEMIVFKGTKNYQAIFSAKGELLKKEEGSVYE